MLSSLSEYEVSLYGNHQGVWLQGQEWFTYNKAVSHSFFLLLFWVYLIAEVSGDVTLGFIDQGSGVRRWIALGIFCLASKMKFVIFEKTKCQVHETHLNIKRHILKKSPLKSYFYFFPQSRDLMTDQSCWRVGETHDNIWTFIMTVTR